MRSSRGGGEGSPQWWFPPETKSEWRTHQVFDEGKKFHWDRKREAIVEQRPS